MTVVAPKGKVQSGFPVDSDSMSPMEMSNSAQAHSSSANSIGNSHTSSKGSPHSGNSDNTSTGEHHSSGQYRVTSQENEQDLPDGASSFGYGSSPQRPSGNQYPEYSPYLFEHRDLENSTTSLPIQQEAKSVGHSDATSRLTNSEPAASTHNVVGKYKGRRTRIDGDFPVLEDKMKPWISQDPPKPLNPFDKQYHRNEIISERYDRENGSENHPRMSTYTFQAAEERYGAAAVLSKWQKESGDQIVERSSTTKARSNNELLEGRYNDMHSRNVDRLSELDLEEQIMEQQFRVGKPQLECIDEREDMYTDRYSTAFADTTGAEALNQRPKIVERSQPSSYLAGESSGVQLHRRHFDAHGEREVEGGREKEQWGGQESGRSTSTHSPYGSTNPFDSELDLLMEDEENGERRGEWRMQGAKGRWVEGEREGGRERGRGFVTYLSQANLWLFYFSCSNYI